MHCRVCILYSFQSIGKPTEKFNKKYYYIIEKFLTNLRKMYAKAMLSFFYLQSLRAAAFGCLMDSILQIVRVGYLFYMASENRKL